MHLASCRGVVFVALLFAAFLPSTVASAEDYSSVELIRDRWGVPHVFADTDEGAMYGLGYATAQDRAFQMHYMLRIIQGRLAETVGDVRKVRRDESAVENDLAMRTIGFYRTADEAARKLDGDFRILLEAYCDGVNACIREDLEKLHPLFQKLDWTPEPWTPADCIASWWHLGQFFATDGLHDLMQYRNLSQGTIRDPREMLRGRGGPSIPTESAEDLTPLGPDDAAAVVRREDVDEAWIEKTHTYLRQHGFRDAEGGGAGQGAPTVLSSAMPGWPTARRPEPGQRRS